MRNFEVPLQEIASVRTILTFRDKAPHFAEDGHVLALTIKDLVGNKPLSENYLSKIAMDEIPYASILSEGNILIPGRGDYYPARYFTELSKPVIPVGQINIITVSKKLEHLYANPHYVTWFLNRVESQAFIKNSLTGTNIQSLSKGKLLDLPIILPTKEVQESISRIQILQKNRIEIRDQLNNIEILEIENLCQSLLLKDGKYE